MTEYIIGGFIALTIWSIIGSIVDIVTDGDRRCCEAIAIGYVGCTLAIFIYLVKAVRRTRRKGE